MRLIFLLILLICAHGVSHGCQAPESIPTFHMKVLQLNIWQEGTMVDGGFEAIVDEIVHTNADVVFLSEVRNYNDKKFIPRILQALALRGKTFFGEHSPLDVSILSKYPIEEQEVVYPIAKGSGSILRATFKANSHTIAAYSAHLDYKNYACYLPRGYNGATWKKMDAPVNNADTILAANRISQRDEAIQIFLKTVRKDIKAKNIILLGGDFNEPSHLDWQADTRHLWEHNGVAVNWDCSTLLYTNGFRDAYRVLYPDVIQYPGFTFPSDNKDTPVSKLAWAPDADERDRIDFIYYYPSRRIVPIDGQVVGPTSSIVKGERKEEVSKDKFLTPVKIWPSDHKAVLIEFKLYP